MAPGGGGGGQQGGIGVIDVDEDVALSASSCQVMLVTAHRIHEKRTHRCLCMRKTRKTSFIE